MTDRGVKDFGPNRCLTGGFQSTPFVNDFGMAQHHCRKEVSHQKSGTKGRPMKPTILLLLLIFIPIMAFVVKTSGQDVNYSVNKGAKETGPRWEYLVVAGPSSSNFQPTGNSRMRKEEGSFGREAFVLEQHMDRMGSQGWELITVSGSPQDPVFYFKRLK
jgi:hypothetical protein